MEDHLSSFAELGDHWLSFSSFVAQDRVETSELLGDRARDFLRTHQGLSLPRIELGLTLVSVAELRLLGLVA